MTENEPIRLLRLKDLIPIIGMQRSWILEKSKSGEFPKPIKLGERAIAWRESEVRAWVVSRKLAE